jgi:Domain of unknown function (DUF4124)
MHLQKLHYLNPFSPQLLHRAQFKLVFLVLISAGLAASVSARSPIYRCTVNGQTVLTDKPCDGGATAAVLGVAAPAASGPVSGQVSGAQSIVGDWRGQTQFQGAENTQVIEAAHSVVPLVLTFSADGKVSGASADNGCSLLGLWAPGLTPRLFNLDITLKGCHVAGLNRRYAGTLMPHLRTIRRSFRLRRTRYRFRGSRLGDMTSERRCGGELYALEVLT